MKMGTAFQIIDDCLDLEGEEARVGKTLGTDAGQGKVTLPVLQYLRSAPETDVSRQIAKFVADLIEDGSTLQMGIGAIPDAVLRFVKDRKHLGVHSEMISDGVMELMEVGAVDNSRKEIGRGRTISICLTRTS